MGWISCYFNGSIDGMKAEFTIQFRFEKLQTMIWELSKQETISGESLKCRMNGWLLEVIGSPPPYEYDWGFISNGVYPHTGEETVAVAFKYKLLDMGITDFKEYCEILREIKGHKG